jgi:hypothetical protein
MYAFFHRKRSVDTFEDKRAHVEAIINFYMKPFCTSISMSDFSRASSGIAQKYFFTRSQTIVLVIYIRILRVRILRVEKKSPTEYLAINHRGNKLANTVKKIFYNNTLSMRKESLARHFVYGETTICSNLFLLYSERHNDRVLAYCIIRKIV